MAIMLGKTHAALKAAGVSDEQAEAAAEEIAGYENRLSSIDNRLSVIEGKLTMVIWAIGINAATTIAILGVLLRGQAPSP